MADVMGKLRTAVFGSYLDRAAAKAVKEQGAKTVKGRLAMHELSEARKAAENSGRGERAASHVRAHEKVLKKIGFENGAVAPTFARSAWKKKPFLLGLRKALRAGR